MAKSNKNFLYWVVYGLIFAFTIYFATISISQAIQEQKEFELFKQSWQYVADTNFEKITEIDEKTNEQVTYYGISTPEQLAGAFMQSQSVHAESITSFSGYKLTSNIDLSGKAWTTTDFSGVFDGNSFHIQNLTICHSANNIGFVGNCSGTIKNVYFDNINVILQKTTGSTYYIGAVAGQLTGTIQNVYVNSGTIDGSASSNDHVRYAGGLVGYNQGTIKNCINKANVIQSGYVGGITGYNSNGTIQNCINNSNGIECGNNGLLGYIGGICGYNYSGNISLCVNNGNISQRNNPSLQCKTVYAGGIVGVTSRTIDQCANEGNISAGYGPYPACYSDSSCVGGIAGFSSANITNCYNTGVINAYAKEQTTSVQNIETNADAKFASNINGGYTLYIKDGEHTSSAWNDGGYYKKNTFLSEYYDYVAQNVFRGGICGFGGYITISNCYNTGTVYSSDCEVKRYVTLHFKWRAQQGTGAQLHLLIKEVFNYGRDFRYDTICPSGIITKRNCYSSSSTNEQSYSKVNLTQEQYSDGKLAKTNYIRKSVTSGSMSGKNCDWYLEKYGSCVYYTIHGITVTDNSSILFWAQYYQKKPLSQTQYYKHDLSQRSNRTANHSNAVINQNIKGGVWDNSGTLPKLSGLYW